MNLHNTSMPALWNAVKNGHLVPDMNAAQYVVSAIAQASDPYITLLESALASIQHKLSCYSYYTISKLITSL